MPVSQECLETRTKESTRLEPTAIGGELWIACEGTLSPRVDAPTVPNFSVRTKESNTCVQVFSRESLDTCSADNRDLVSQRHEKVNAWICVRPTTDRGLASVIPDWKKENKRKREKERCKSVGCEHAVSSDMVLAKKPLPGCRTHCCCAVTSRSPCGAATAAHFSEANTQSVGSGKHSRLLKILRSKGLVLDDNPLHNRGDLHTLLELRSRHN